MRILLSLSAKQVGQLYHKTTKQALLAILRSGKLELSTGRGTSIEHKHLANRSFFASFTRSRYGAYHFREEGRRSVYSNEVMITLDGNKLSQREKIVPVDYWGNRGATDPNFANGKEVEERLISNKPEVDILKHIVRVDFIFNAVHGEIETYGFDKGKFKLRENDRQQQYLASILLQLKKHKIKYGFYDSFKDWALKRNEFTYIGPKDVAKDKTYHGDRVYAFKHLRALLEALTDAPFEKLTTDAKKIAEQAYRYPQDIGAIFNDYENYRKPESPVVAKKWATKIANLMQRQGLNTIPEAGKFLSSKTDKYYKEQERLDAIRRANEAAPLILGALTKDVADWPTSKNVWIDPRQVFLEIKDSFGYRFDEARRLIEKTISSEGTAIDKLKAAMSDLGLKSAYDVAYYIYDTKVKSYVA